MLNLVPKMSVQSRMGGGGGAGGCKGQGLNYYQDGWNMLIC